MMDRSAVVYRGHPPDLVCVDQALRILHDGRWVVIFMTGGAGEPQQDNHIVISVSEDEGASWSSPENLLRYDDRACLLSEVFVDGERLLMFASTHDGRFADWRCWTVESHDGGRSWDAPRPLEPLPRNTFVRNRFCTSWGEWIFPVQTYRPPKNVDGLPEILNHGFNGALITCDGGNTWELSNMVGPTRGWVENNIVELSDGRLVMLIRADGTGHLLRSESKDRGRSWSAPQATDIPNPGAKFRLHRLSDGRICLVHNPDRSQRHPLALWISSDDMQTWQYRRVLVDFPGRLSYPDGVVDADETYIHFAFDYNRHDVIYIGAKLPDA
ncbi:MAG: sialidase family protein [Armatimonadota bacterium]